MSFPDVPIITPASLSHIIRRQQSNEQCSAEASRSATEAIRQASQSASQQIQQATISASNAIRDAQNSASQSVAAASRSSSSISSSAASAMASVISSAERAVLSAQSDASRAMFRANLAMGQATASSVLPDFSRGGPPRMTGIRSEADLNNRIQAGPGFVVTPAQIALAVIGTIIASLLFSLLGYFILHKCRRRRDADQLARRRISWKSNSFNHPFTAHKHSNSDSSTEKVEHAQKMPPSMAQRGSMLLARPLPWLKIHKPLSPFGSIRLSGSQSDGTLPLGGQLKSPLTSVHPRIPDLKAPLPAVPQFQQSRTPSPHQTLPPQPTRPAPQPRSPVSVIPIATPTTSTADTAEVPEPSNRPFQAYPKLKIRAAAPNLSPIPPDPSSTTRTRRNIAPFIEAATRARYEQARASVWNAESPLAAPPGISPEQREDGVRTTLLAMPIPRIGTDGDGESVKTPDTATLKTMRFGTAVQGRVLNPSVLGDGRGR